MQRWVMVLILLCASGCMMGPDYKRPDISQPKTFRHASKHATGSVDTAWWKEFHDPTLNRLIEEALANNQDIKIAVANLEQAEGELMTTRAALFPQIGYEAAGTRIRFPGNDALPGPNTNPFNNFQVLGSVSWEIDLWGRLRRMTESARANVLASEEARQGVILSLVAEVGSAYIELRALDEQLRISKNTLKSYADSLHLFELQHQYGQVSDVTVQQARSQYELVQAAIPRIQIQIARTENTLSVLLGRAPGAIIRGLPDAAMATPSVPAGLPSQLLVRRPDILQAEQNLVAANAQIGAAVAQYFPAFSLTGMFGKSSQVLSTLWQGQSSLWSYGGGVTGPIFTGGAIQGQVIQAKGATKAALHNYQKTVLQAFAEVDNAIVACDKLKKQWKAEQNRVAAYRQYHRLAWYRYNGGYSPYLEVLFAETQLYPAELSAVQSKAATLISVINLYKAMGGGWVREADKMTRLSMLPHPSLPAR